LASALVFRDPASVSAFRMLAWVSAFRGSVLAW
jgi:hypothetical protein